MKSSFSILLVFVFTILFSQSFAADRYFKTGATSWGSASSWSATSPSGTDNAGVPTSADRAIFQAGSGNCSLSSTTNVRGILIQTGYTGTITQGSNQIEVGSLGFTQEGGVFNSGANVTVSGGFSISGGTYSASASLNLSGTVNIGSAYFIANSSQVNISNSLTNTLDGITFNDLTLSGSQTVSITNSVIVNGNLIIQGLTAINGAPLQVKGHVTNSVSGWSGNSKIVFIGSTAVQNILGTSQFFGVSLEINKTAGEVRLNNNLTLVGSTTDLILTQGTLSNQSNYNLTLPRDFVRTAGTFLPGSGTVSFTGPLVSLSNITLGRTTFNNESQIITIGYGVYISGILTFQSLATLNGSSLNISGSGSITLNDTNWNGTGKITFTGVNTNTISSYNGGVCGVSLEVNKTGGQVNVSDLILTGSTSDLILTQGTLAGNSSGTITLPRNMLKTSGVFTPSGTVVFTGPTATIDGITFNNVTFNNPSLVVTLSQAITVNGIVRFTDLATLNGANLNAVSSIFFTDSEWNGTGKIVATGTSIGGSGVCGVSIDFNSSSMVLNGNLTLTGETSDLSVVGGSLNLSTRTITLPRNFNCNNPYNIAYGTSTVIFTGTTANIGSAYFYNLTFNNANLVANLPNNTTVYGVLTFTSLSQLNGNPLTFRGNVIFNDSDWSGTSKLLYTSNTAQTVTGSGVCGVTLEVSCTGSLALNSHFTLVGTSSNLLVTWGLLSCGGTYNVTLPGNFVVNYVGGAGLFSSNNSTFIFTGSTPTITVNSQFKHLTLNNPSMVANFTNNTIITGTLTLTELASINGSPLEARGNVVLSDTGWNGNSKIIFNSNAAQTLSGNGSLGVNVDINKTGSTLTVSNSPVFARNFNYIAGTVNWGTATPKFGQAGYVGNPIITSNGLQFNHVEIATDSADTLTLSGDLIVNGNFHLNNANIINGNSFRLRGNINLTDTAITGTANSLIDGSGNQTITGAGTLPGNNSAETIINKPSGNLTLLSNISLSNIGQDLRLVKGNLELNGYNLAVSDYFRVFDKMTLKGSETITVNLLTTPAITNPNFTISGTSSTIEYTDSAVVANITKLSKTFNNLTLGAGKTHEIATGVGNGITINGVFASNGSAANRSVLRSLANASSPWQLNLQGSSTLTDKVNVKYSDATLGLTVQAIDSINSGNNLNWSFGNPVIASVTSPLVNGSYKQGTIVPIQVSFNEPVVVIGLPQLTLETGSIDRLAVYESGSGTAVLTFNYTIQAGDATSDLDYINSNALSLNGGSIKNNSNLDAILNLVAPGSAGSLGANKNLVIYTFAATTQNFTIAEDSEQTVILSSNYAGTNSLTYSITTSPAHGNLVLMSGSTYKYTPNLNYSGPDSFIFKANDGSDSLSATVTFTITPINDAPIAVNDSFTTNSNSPYSFDPTLNDSDPEGDSLNITGTTNGTKGNVTFSGNILTYTPNANESGSDSFTYTISDGNGGSAVGVIEVTILFVPNNLPPVVLPLIKLEAIKQSTFTFDLALHIQDEDKNSLIYELQNQPLGMIISNTGVISMANVGTTILTYEFSVKITDNAQNEVITNIQLDVVENLLDPNVIVQLNKSAITISASGVGDFPFVPLRTLLLANSNHDAEWLETEYDHTNYLTYFGVTDLLNLPSKITVTIAPTEEFHSQNIIKAGLALLNGNGGFSKLYETTDLTFTSSYNRYVMYVNSREVNSEGAPFSQGLNQIVMFTQLINGTTTYYLGSKVVVPVDPYLRNVVDESRIHTVVEVNGETKYQYNHLIGFANGLFVDTQGPEIEIHETVLANNKITVIGSLNDAVGADYITAIVSLKNISNEYIDLDPNAYNVVSVVSNGLFNLEITDKDANNQAISTLSVGSQIKISLSSKDFLNNTSSKVVEQGYYPLGQLVQINSLSATANGNGYVLISYQATILDNNYELDEIRINNVLETPALSGSVVKSALEGKNYYQLAVKIKNISNPSQTFTVNKTVEYSLMATVVLQNFTITGANYAYYGKISPLASLGRQIIFDLANPNSLPLNIKITIFNHFTHETTDLNILEYQPGKYRVISELDLTKTIYDITLTVKSGSLVHISETLTIQNGNYALVSSGPFSLENPPTLTIIEAQPLPHAVFINGQAYTLDTPLILVDTSPLNITVDDFPFQATVMAQDNLPGIDLNGNVSGSSSYDSSNKAIEISYPQKPIGSFPTPIIKTTDQYLRGIVSSKFISLMVTNNRNGKVVTAELKTKGQDLFEFSAYLNFLEEGENSLLINAISADPTKSKSMLYEVLFDRKGPEVTISFGTNYDGVPVPEIFGYISLYKTLIVEGLNKTQTDYDFKIEIKDDNYLGKDINTILNNTSLIIAKNHVNYNDLDLFLSEDKKVLTGTMKLNSRIIIGNKSGLYLAQFESKDYIGNYAKKVKQFNFNRGELVKLKLKPKIFNIILPYVTPDYVPAYLYTTAATPSSLGSSELSTQVAVEEGTTEFGPCAKIVSGQTLETTLNLYEGGAIEQAALMANGLQIDFSVMVGAGGAYKPLYLFATSYFMLPPEDYPHMCPRHINLADGEIIPNTEKFGMFFFKVPVTVQNYLDRIKDLRDGKIAPSQAYVKTGRDTSDFPYPDVNGDMQMYRGYWPIAYSMQEVEYPSPYQEDFDPFRVVFPSQETTELSFVMQHVSLIQEAQGYVDNNSSDSVLITLLSGENLATSNKFKSAIEVDRSGQPEGTTTFHEDPSIPYQAIIGNLFWDNLQTMPPLDPPIGFVPPWVSPNIQGVDSYAIIDKGYIDQEYGMFKDSYQWTYIQQKFDACEGIYVLRNLYVQEEFDDDNKANIEYVLKIGEHMPSDIEIRYTEELIWADIFYTPSITISEFFEPFLSKENVPFQAGHYRPADSISFVESGILNFLRNRLDLFIEGIAFFESTKEVPYESHHTEKFIQPIFYDEFTFKITDIFIDEEGKLNFTQNVPDSFKLLDVLEFKGDSPREELLNSKALNIQRGENRFLISKIIEGEEEYPVYLDVLIGDGDFNYETSNDLFVENFRVNTQFNLPTFYLGQYEVIKYNLLQYSKNGGTRSGNIQSINNNAVYQFDSDEKSWASFPVYFLTPSYYQLISSTKFKPETNAKFLLAEPGKPVNISQSGYNSFSPEVKGVVFKTESSTNPILELNYDDEYGLAYYERISMNNGIASLYPTITTYDDTFNVTSTYTLPVFKTYNERNQDDGSSNKLDEFNSLQHFVEGPNNSQVLLQKFKFISRLEDANLPINADKNCIFVKNNGAVAIKVGDQTNIYRIGTNAPNNIQFEAITGITPRVGANSMSSSEFIIVNDGSGSVFAHNKQFIHSQVDMTVAGRATSLSFIRTYRSGVNTDSGLGSGWDHNFNKYFIVDDDNNLIWYQGNGRNDKITNSGDDTFVMPSGFYCKLELLEPNTDKVHYRVSYNNGSYEEYRQIDYRFKLTKQVDANDNIVKISWNKNSFVAYADNDKALSFYSTHQVAGLSDGNRSIYYFINRHLESVIYEDKAISFGYSIKGMLVTITTPAGIILTNNYSSANGKEYQVVSQTANGINYTFEDLTLGGVAEIISASGVASLRTEYHMQSNDLESQLSKYPKEIIYPGQTTEKVSYGDNKLEIFQIGQVTSRKNITSKTTYKNDSNIFSKGLVEKVEVLKAPGSDENTPNAISASFEYSTKTIHGNTIYFVSESTDARLVKTVFEHNNKGNMIKKSVESDNGFLDTLYQYDSYGRLQGSVGPNGATVANVYYDFVDTTLTISATGWLRRTISDGTVGAQNLSKINALIAKDTPNIRRDNPTLQVVDFAYDAIGNTTTVVDTFGRASLTEYDKFRRVIKTTGPNFGGNGHVSVQYLYEGQNPGGTDKCWNKWTTCTSEIPYPIISDSQSDSKIEYGKKTAHTTREYNQYGWLTKEFSHGQETEFVLDGFGRTKASKVKGEEKAPDQIVTHAFDNRGNVETTIVGDNDDDATNGVFSENSETATVYQNTFDASDNMDETYRNGSKISKTILDGLDRPVGSCDYTTNTKTEQTLDLGSNPTAIKAGKLDKANNQMSETLVDVGRKVDKLGVATETTDNLRKNEAGQIEKSVSGMAYDIKKKEVKQFNPNFHNGSNFDETAAVTTSSDNLVKTTKYPDGTVIITEFNADGTVKHVTKDESDVVGTDGEIKKRRSRFEYDDSGYLIMDIVQEHDTGDKFNDPTSGIIAKNTYVNDGVGRKILITDARGNKVKNDYNELGQLTSVVTGFGSNSAITKTMEYYKTGQLKSESQGNQTTAYTYNSRGSVVEVRYTQDAKTEVESYTYNNKALLKTKTLRHKEGDPAVVLTYKYEYEIDADTVGDDETDFLAQVWVGNKLVREYGDYTQNDVSFYELGQPKYAIEHNRFRPNGSIDPSGSVVMTFDYNSARQVIKETSYVYNMDGQLQEKEVKRHFNKAGQLKSLVYPSLVNSGLQYSYDKMNRLLSIRNVANTPIKAFSYYGLGKVGVSSEGNGKIVQRFSYDKQDWLQSISSLGGTFDAGNFTFKRENNGIKESVKYTVNSLTEKVDEYKYDAQNRLISSDYTGKAFGQDLFTLDNLDNILSGKTNGVPIVNVLKDSVRIDTSNGVAFQFDTRGNTIEDDKYKYEWDHFDRIRFIENKSVDPLDFVNDRPYLDGTSATSATEFAVTFNFNSDALPMVTVDTLYLLNEVIENEFVIEYKISPTDPQEEWKPVTYQVTIDTVNGASTFNFSDIDVRQIRIREINSNGTFALDNNSSYEFKDFVYPPGIWHKIEYLYDANGRRVQKIVDNKVGHWYIFDGYQMIEERTYSRGDGQTTLRRQVVYGTAINEPVYIYDANANENYYLLKNDQNTVLALYKASDTAGSVPREQYEYSGYGITNILDQNGLVKTFDHDLNVNTPEIKKVKSDFSNPFGYQGMWRDEHTGLYHTHYRLYDPQHVRWLTPDPAGYRDGQNLYRFYAGPNGVDVLGLDEKSARHHIEIAEGLYSRVQQRIRNTESGNEAANTPEFIALTQQLYASYLKVRANAIDDVNNYLATTNAAFIKYDLAERMMRLGEVAAVGQISAKSELCDAKITSSLLSSNIDSLDTMITTAEYSGYAGNTILVATGVGSLALIAKHIAVNSAKQAVLFGIHKGATYATKETASVVASLYVGSIVYEASVETIKQNVGEEYKAFVDPLATVITSSANVASSAMKGVKGFGVYILEFANGYKYVGKGGGDVRLKASINQRTKEAGAPLTAWTWISTKTEKAAYILEHKIMQLLGKSQAENKTTPLLNRIKSKGAKYDKE